jgi:hypothetical protein
MNTHQQVNSANRAPAQRAAKTSVAARQTALSAAQAGFSITRDDVSSLVTFVPVGILALLTFGLLLSPF